MPIVGCLKYKKHEFCIFTKTTSGNKNEYSVHAVYMCTCRNTETEAKLSSNSCWVLLVVKWITQNANINCHILVLHRLTKFSVIKANIIVQKLRKNQKVNITSERTEIPAMCYKSNITFLFSKFQLCDVIHVINIYIILQCLILLQQVSPA